MNRRPGRYRHLLALACVVGLGVAVLLNCSDDDKPNEPTPAEPRCPVCDKPVSTRVDGHTPHSEVADWQQPVRLGAPISSPCPEDAIEISGDGQYLYFMFTVDLLDSMSAEQILAPKNNTYRAARIGDPGEFDSAFYYDLARTTTLSLDGELSFTSDGSKVYFHSNRSSNTGYVQGAEDPDFIDIYVADIVDGLAGTERNLGSPPNSIYPDGEHCIHPDDTTLYFASHRPGGRGGSDIWVSVFTAGTWTEPVNAGATINSIFNDLQPTFTPDGDTMYFASGRNFLIGAAIYRTVKNGAAWSAPELVISGVVGEPSLTDDGRYLYFVHVLSDQDGTYDADIWYSERTVQP